MWYIKLTGVQLVTTAMACDFTAVLKRGNVMSICSYSFGLTRWSPVAEKHREKNLQVSRAHSWDFMARFTPCVILQGGGRGWWRGEDSLTLCRAKWNGLFSFFSCWNSYWGNSASRAFDTCTAPGGNTFAQRTRQLILSMSSALGGRMKQRFDLIGSEKVSHLGPVGKEEGYRGKRLAHARTDARCFDLSVWLSSFPKSPNLATSMGVQNKHTLIGQLITGTNTGGRSLRGPLWLHLVRWLF